MNIFKLSTLLIVFSAFTFRPEPTVLEHKFKVGDAYELKQVTTQTMTQSIPGAGDVNTETKSESLMLLKIIAVDKNIAKAELTYTKVKSDTKSPYVNLTLDSEGDQNVPLNKVLKAIANTTVVAYITRTGAVEKFENLDKLPATISGMGLDPNTQAAAQQIAAQYLGEGYLKVGLEQSLLQYSESKVKIGDTWKSSSIAPLIPIQTVNVWKLTAIDGQVASLESDGTMVTMDSTKEFAVQGFRARANMKGRVAARAKADLASGMPKEIKAVSEVKGIITILAGGQIPEDMGIPTEIVNEVEHTVTKK